MAQSNDINEADAFISRRPEKQTKLQSFCSFLYDKNTGTVLGRTGKSWFQIGVFYIIFYACLAGFFAICLAVFIQTLDDNAPKYFGKGSIIGINPGLGYQPWLKDDPESTLIKFVKDNPRSYHKYTSQLSKFFYGNDTDPDYIYYTKDEKSKMKDCTGEEANFPDDETDDACRFDWKSEGDACTLDADDEKRNGTWGFDVGKPCVVLSLNRLIDWTPIPYPKDSIPSVLGGQRDTKDVAVHCEGEYPADKDNIGTRQYYPKNGFKHQYFPYRFYTKYQQPLVFVQFESLKEGQLIMIECKAYAYNIIHDRSDKLGMVHFEILMEPAGTPFKEES